MARKAKLTDEARDLYLRAIAAGVPPEVAARHADFSPATLYRRLQGRTAVDAEFKAAHDKALAAFEIRLVATVSKAALTDPRVAFELLARRFPARWSRGNGVTSLDESNTPIGPAEETLMAVDPALIGELIPRLLEAGRILSGRPMDEEIVDVSDFEDDGSTDEVADTDQGSDAQGVVA